ncbi:MAG: right-handed parallel beta-helix repeat-containing protein [Verrucomicrobia bacterium]|jgi:hypothetical protein|nr:right-handed parallel beta-helix repeat-containing protein [Verrucomicrobiota bacterium]OQC67426.1 MAG: hypothetical protein BWX48_00791 [Verrucomicrobia bacterium ADurb.Bin006]MDI9380163.1 right-handed parallel beta-helix repeat-containing protein [Verrucomicrobiota bacterium]HOA60036.1 right-handed parallel beta-helix repeat-containing protein [Verrucomicrobiota bacterium]HOF47598.1 right-handed parallel beta-helix repeat-containing protein [Verrucomicrobiota bacterium]
MKRTLSLSLLGSLWLWTTAPAGLAQITIATDTFIAAGDMWLDGQAIVVDHATLTVEGPHTFSSLQLANSAVLTHEPAAAGQPERAVRLIVTGNVTVDATSRIDATGKGYAQADSPGAGAKGNYAGGGGGHGGHGHRSNGTPGLGGMPFGSIVAPDTWGGPGGNSDSTGAFVPGGGLIHIEVGETLTVDGAVRADGANAWINNQGGGAGGTVYLKAGTLAGAGTISVNGGRGEWTDGGGGAGGRMALLFASNQFAGTLSAIGSGGAGFGGAGTIYLKQGTTQGQLRIVNTGRGEWTPLTSPVAFDVELDGNAIAYATANLTVGTLSVAGNSMLTHSAGSAGLTVSASGNVSIGADAGINVDGRGYPFAGDPGPGAGQLGIWAGSGAGHGGLGGNSKSGYAGGSHYGSILQPTALGSQGGDGDGGPGSSGGGAIRLIVAGTLDVAGRLSANGIDNRANNAGGGSGGSIWVNAGSLTGGGTIVANGGAGEWVDGGGGGGGRIALYSSLNQFTGTLTAYGAGGSQRGGAGTIYVKRTANPVGHLLVDNDNAWGNYTPIATPEAFDLTISRRAVCYPVEALTVTQFTMPNEAVLTHLQGQSNIHMRVTGNASIAAPAQFTVDGRGYPIGEDRGPGAGSRYSWGGSGGGHAGLGGRSGSGAVGGSYYGSLLEPTALGSQGGDGSGGPGTAGGGAIRLIVDGTLTLDGRLSANGAGAPPDNAGGGSGGSIWLTVGSLSGAGTISANGGAGEWVDGGGGGGGRIALYYTSRDYSGAITAYGASGHERGGAGTIYTKGAVESQGHLLVDNGGTWGTYTPLQTPEALRATLTGRAWLYPESALIFTRLELPGEAVLTHLTGQSNVTLHVVGDLIVGTNSALSVEGRGYPIGKDRGPGTGIRVSWGGSGGSHGGLGGWSGSSAGPTIHYGSMLEPTLLGSQGGDADGGPGTAGGGAIRLIVDGTLRVDGALNANGAANPPNNAGGGAGGSVWLTVAKLAGTGRITANGGPGEWVDGGGGGGGRIALYYDFNEFAGIITAFGNGGHQRGGAGTVYTRKRGSAFGQLLISNGGVRGNYTPLTSPEPFQLTLAEMAYCYHAEPLTVRDFEVRTNAVLTHLTGQARCEITVLNNLTVAEGGSISTDGRGYPIDGNLGPGAGVRLDWGGSGAGHGGTGGTTILGAAGGAPYGSITEPLEHGSAGGPGDGGAGGAGGGVVRLNVANLLTIDGRVTAQGLNGVSNNSGGGAGGSLYLTAKTIAGKGAILADGGAGEWVDGGGGAGGRIALYADAVAFSGDLAARGGGGHQRGGSGSIYTKLTGQATGELVLDNGGNAGALSPFDVPANTRLVLGGGSVFYPTGPLELVSLLLKSGATLTHITGQSNLTVHVAGDLSVESGAAITADGKGYPLEGDPGPGAGESLGCCGGGGAHGGNGGVSLSGAAGGLAYGSVIEPVHLGSSGGGTGARSPGGGAIRLVVGGTLELDGTLSANGTSSWYDNQGGAAGGSIWITAEKLAGAGAVSAIGGKGEWVDGGSGGGGRIAFYLGADEFTGTVSARGGAPGRQAGGAGTIYARFAGETTGRVLIDNADTWGAYTPLACEEPFDLTLARRAQVIGDPDLTLSSLVVETNTVLTHLKEQDGLKVVVAGDATISGAVNTDGRGFPVGVDPGPGAGGQSSYAGSGAGHGGVGGTSRTGLPGGPTYGSQLEPTLRGSQGGSGSGGAGGHGGGAVRFVVGGTLTVDGSITANGLNGTASRSGGGSGGSVFVSTRALSGAGSIAANGGAGQWVDGGGGSGGRIALYRTTSTFTGALAANGAGGFARGENGTIYESTAPSVLWMAPGDQWAFGTIALEVATLTGETGPLTADFSAWQNGVSTAIGTVPAGLTAKAAWDTTRVADGAWELHVAIRTAAGVTVVESRRSITVNNAVEWHGGPLAASEVWAPGRVHVVDRDLTIASGLELTLNPGTIVKFLPGVRLSILSGGVLNALGDELEPCVLTSFLDDSEGGDSNLDGDLSKPTPGSWRLALRTGATIESNDHTRFRFNSRIYGGPLAGSETWTADSLREITTTIVVPAGATLTLEAGAIVKFHHGIGLDVQSGGKLIARGTVSQPVVFTSISDDAYGGDTNEDGTHTGPAAGDWRSLHLEDGAQGDLNHTRILYGGNSVGTPSGAGGAIETLGGPFIARNCVIADALKDGAFCYGTTRFENCVVLRCDRGLTAVGEMTIINCTLDANKIGLLEHVGHLIVRNSIVSGSIQAGIEHDLGGYSPTVTFCNVWNPEASRGNYSGTSDRTGVDGNISAAPKYKNAVADNYRLDYTSPGIDAADGTFAPETDAAGTPRYDDPRTGNTGIAAANGAIPDMGAFEFAETAPSNLDLVVIGVSGPGHLEAGSLVHIEWTIANRGTEAFTGPWHDAIYLRNDATGRRIAVGEPLVGRNLTLGPGQRQLVGVDVRVPGGVAGDYTWVVVANSRGDIFEGANSSNNEGDAALASSLTLPVIALDGASVTSAFSAQEEPHWFQCTAPVGKDVRFDLGLLGSQGVTELYVGRGFMPTAEDYSARQREWSSADTSAVVSGAADATTTDGMNVFYVLAIGRTLSATPQAFALSASSAAFSIEAAWPQRVGNASLVTLDIRGSALTTNTAFLVRVDNDERLAVRQSVRESGRVFATFDLTDLAPGKADLVAEAGGLEVVLPEAVEVVAGGTPDFYTSLSGPGTTRAGRFMTWFVTYGNRGLVDMKAPLLKFNAPRATEINLYESTLNWADSFTFWGINPEALLPTLGPGQEVTFEVRVKAMNSGTVNLEMITGEAFASNATPFNWGRLPATPGANPAAWAAMVNGLDDRLGATPAEYSVLLDRDLEGLAASELRFSYLANIDGRWLFGNEPEGVSAERPLILVPEDYEEPGLSPGLHNPPGAPRGDGIRKTWWLVITVEDYTYLPTTNLPGTRKDARDLWDYANTELRVPEGQYLWAHDMPGDDQAVRRSTMLDGIRELKGKVDADDNLVIVFCGHGGLKWKSGAPYLCFNGDYLSPVAFTQAIDEVGAGTTYFLNDSCHSEAFNEKINPANTTFVGFAATQANKISWDTASGGNLIKNLKGQLRKCRSLGRAMELTTDMVTKKYENEPKEKNRQQPVLTNPSGASLDGKPWNDPSGFEQLLRNALRNSPFPSIFPIVPYAIVGSVDPNDKYTLAGVGPEHWIDPNHVIPFEVLFENKPTAAAPAQEVLVTDTLDANLDWSTFELKTIAFNDATITVPPGLQRYSTTASVGSDTNEVTVDVSFDSTTGKITWLMRSRDANTGDLPEDPFAGFLPPNDAQHRGEGLLTYTVRPKLTLSDGAKIRNQATIIFDPTYGANPPILTPTVTNTIDATAPLSQIEPLPAQSSGPVTLSWAGQDAAGGSGLQSYDLFISRNGGPFQLQIGATTATSAFFEGEPGSTYRFYTIARDAAGNTEAAPAEADAVTTFAGGITYTAWAASQGLPPNAANPEDDPDNDGLPNLGEYGLASNPKVADWPSVAPKAGMVRLAGETYLTLTYRRPKPEPSDLQYRVTSSSAVVPWTGASAVATVGTPVDRGNYVEVTVRSLTPMKNGVHGFLQLQLRK